jgi:hypothetical protein
MIEVKRVDLMIMEVTGGNREANSGLGPLIFVIICTSWVMGYVSGFDLGDFGGSSIRMIRIVYVYVGLWYCFIFILVDIPSLMWLVYLWGEKRNVWWIRYLFEREGEMRRDFLLIWTWNIWYERGAREKFPPCRCLRVPCPRCPVRPIPPDHPIPT